MCIAIYSPKGVKPPIESFLQKAFENNPDGAGFAFNTNHGTVKIVKGMMDWESFIAKFQMYDKKFNFQDRGLLLHFRITTHGGTSPECCHPFPISSDEGILHKIEYESPYAVIHNGIISLTSYDAKTKQKMSDTMVFISKYLSRLATNRGWFDNPENFELIYDMIDSKMAILNGKGEIKSTYGFTKDEDGNYYSNTSYKEERHKNLLSYGAYDYSALGYYSEYEWADRYLDSDSKPTIIPMHRIKPGEIVIMEDGEEISFENDFDYYVTEYDEVFMGGKLKTNYFASDKDYPCFIGYGTVMTSSYQNVKFRGDFYADNSKL